MIFSTVLTASLALLASAHYAPDGCPRKIGAAGVQVRLPPIFNTTNPHHHGEFWRPPPVGFYFKPWSIILATNPQYSAMRNIQYDPTPVDPSDPTGLVNDLFSFQRPGNDTVFTTYGVDTPIPDIPAALRFAATGVLTGATSEYYFLAWGCDANRVPYYSSYSTATNLTQSPAGIDLLSTNDQGPDQATIDAIIKALKSLGNEEITSLVEQLKRIVQDGGRRNMPRVSTQTSLGL